MLNEQDFALWVKRTSLSDPARAVVTHIRSSQPARRVGGGRGNVVGRYPSRKMGVTIQFESHRVELPAVLELEHNDDVLEYYDQPPSIKLDYSSAHGKRLGVLHTPDFFVVRADSAGWEECKTEEDLIRLADRNPNRYCHDERTWSCPPGKQYAEQFGLYYRVRSSGEINWVFQRNLQFLEDYFRAPLEVRPVHRQRVLALVAAQPNGSLQDLFWATEGEVTRDVIYSLIAAGDIFIDLHSASLLEPDKVTVSLEKFAECVRDNHAVIPTRFDREDQASQVQRWLQLASEADLVEGTRRFHIVTRVLRGAPHDFVPPRTLRRWIASYRAAKDQHGSGYLGLLPKRNEGNPASKLPEKVRSLMTQFIEKEYETLKQKTQYAVWSMFKLSCDREKIPAPSYKTFSLAIHQRAGATQTQKRQGHRAAYQRQPFYWELEQRTPRHGDRPFEIAHIDHTQSDVWAVCSQSGRVLGRPWVSLLTDAFSRRILALHITFDPPSYRSCMMIVRECVRRHARLPQILVLDGGKEFESSYFEALLARFEITKKSRPPAKARFGSTCERIFGTANKQFFHCLQGNTQLPRNARQITKSVDPRNHALWALKELHRALSEYAYEIYDTMHHPALGQSPREALDAALTHTGSRAHRRLAYDRDFLIATLPTTRKGTAKISPARGIKINHVLYWSEHFRNPTLETKQVAVRYDPFDIGLTYAFVDRQWVECYSEYYKVLHGHSEREVQLVSEELRKRHQNHSGHFVITARKLAEFLESVELEEEILAQRLRDLEGRSLHDPPERSAKPLVKITDSRRPSPATARTQLPPAAVSTFQTYGEL
jgi:putative transposase